MNQVVELLLKTELRALEDDIESQRDFLSELAKSADTAGKKLDKLTLRRRSIQDHLTVNGAAE